MTEQDYWQRMYLQSVEIRKGLEGSIRDGLVREMKLKEQFVDLVCAIDDVREKASLING
jgi:hypothetical protein